MISLYAVRYSVCLDSLLFISNHDSLRERDNVQHAFQDVSEIASGFDTSVNIEVAFIYFVITFQMVFSFNWVICLLESYFQK